MTQNANFIDLCSIVFFRCRDAWKPQSWFNISNLFMYSTYCCVGERRGWNCLFQRLPFAFNVSISLFFSSEPGPFCVSCFLYMSSWLRLLPFCVNPVLFVSSFNPVLSFQPCLSVFNSVLFVSTPLFSCQPCPFVSTLSFLSDGFPSSLQPCPLVSTRPFCFKLFPLPYILSFRPFPFGFDFFCLVSWKGRCVEP